MEAFSREFRTAEDLALIYESLQAIKEKLPLWKFNSKQKCGVGFKRGESNQVNCEDCRHWFHERGLKVTIIKTKKLTIQINFKCQRFIELSSSIDKILNSNIIEDCEEFEVVGRLCSKERQLASF